MKESLLPPSAQFSSIWVHKDLHSLELRQRKLQSAQLAALALQMETLPEPGQVSVVPYSEGSEASPSPLWYPVLHRWYPA